MRGSHNLVCPRKPTPPAKWKFQLPRLHSPCYIFLLCRPFRRSAGGGPKIPRRSQPHVGQDSRERARTMNRCAPHSHQARIRGLMSVDPTSGEGRGRGRACWNSYRTGAESGRVCPPEFTQQGEGESPSAPPAHPRRPTSRRNVPAGTLVLPQH